MDHGSNAVYSTPADKTISVPKTKTSPKAEKLGNQISEETARENARQMREDVLELMKVEDPAEYERLIAEMEGVSDGTEAEHQETHD